MRDGRHHHQARANNVSERGATAHNTAPPTTGCRARTRREPRDSATPGHPPRDAIIGTGNLRLWLHAKAATLRLSWAEREP